MTLAVLVGAAVWALLVLITLGVDWLRERRRERRSRAGDMYHRE